MKCFKKSKKRIEFIKNQEISSISLRSLSMIENLSNSDSGYFAIFNDKIELIMDHEYNERSS
jgi:hypothetical protein